MFDPEDEMPIPCPVCRERFECSPDCEQIVEDWMRENGDL